MHEYELRVHQCHPTNLEMPLGAGILQRGMSLPVLVVHVSSSGHQHPNGAQMASQSGQNQRCSIGIIGCLQLLRCPFQKLLHQQIAPSQGCPVQQEAFILKGM